MNCPDGHTKEDPNMTLLGYIDATQQVRVQIRLARDFLDAYRSRPQMVQDVLHIWPGTHPPQIVIGPDVENVCEQKPRTLPYS